MPAPDPSHTTSALLLELASPATVRAAASALWELQLNDPVQQQPTHAFLIPAIASLANQLDTLIPSWIDRLFEELSHARDTHKKMIADFKAHRQSAVWDHTNISAIHQLTLALQATGRRIDPHLGPVIQSLKHFSTHKIKEEDATHLDTLYQTLAFAGPGIVPATPHLLNILTKRGIREFPSHLSTSLVNASQYDPTIIPALIKLLASQYERNRQAALHVLGALGPAARVAAPQMLAFKNADPQERCSLIYALSAQGDPFPEFLDILHAARGDPEAYVQFAAVNALLQLTPDPQRFIPLLILACDSQHSLHDGDHIPTAATQALGEYGPPALPALPRLLAFISGPLLGRTVDPKVVAQAIARISPSTPVSIHASPVIKAAPMSADEPLFAVTHHDKLCYIDRQGHLVLQTRFLWGSQFSDDRAIVHSDEQTIIIDRHGREVFQSPWDDIWPYAQGLAAVQKNELWGFVDIHGRVVVEPQYPSVTSFSQGLAGFATPASEPHLSLRGYIDTTGKTAIPAQWISAYPFSQGLACVATSHDLSPHPVWQDQTTTTQVKFGYINFSGSIVIPGQYDSAQAFSSGLAEVQKGPNSGRTRQGYINTAGQVAIPLAFTSTTAFRDGLALVRPRGRNWRSAYCAIDAQGKRGPLLPYFHMTPLSHGLFSAWHQELMGIIDAQGRWVVQPQFDTILPFRHGLAQAQRDHWFTLIDPSGRFVWGPTSEGSVDTTFPLYWT